MNSILKTLKRMMNLSWYNKIIGFILVIDFLII